MNNLNIDYLLIVIPRDEIEKLDIEPTLNVLMQLFKDKDSILTFRNRLNISIHGYDKDSRELSEINEVRAFLTALDKSFPYWFYFADKDTFLLKLIMFSIIDYIKVSEGFVKPNHSQQDDFIEKHFICMNQICESMELSEEVIIQMSMEINDLYSN